ncbi:MAG: GxxExxY protein [Sphingomicrobium sp.]
MSIERLVTLSIDVGFSLHKALGPGLLESVYEALLADRLRRSGCTVERQKILPIAFDGVTLSEGYRVDLLVDGKLIIELKSCEQLLPVHSKQLLTYIRLAHQPVGLLMNFGGNTFREGLRRIVNNAAEVTFDNKPNE